MWDAIVIGSGVGGLSAAAAFAKAGKRVLVLERLSNFGGAATVYRHGSLTMEASLHEVDGTTVYGPNSAFAKLGLTDAVAPIGFDNFYDVRGGPLARPILVPHGFDAAEAALRAALPAVDGAIHRYCQDMRRLHGAFAALEGASGHGLASLGGALLSGGLLELISDLGQSVAQRFDHAFGEHEDAKAALGAMIGYFDDDPAGLSFLFYGGIWGRYLEDRGYYFNGGSRALTAALLRNVKAAGGDARKKCTAREILLDDVGAACGVRYETAEGAEETVEAPIVFANVAPSMLAAMLPADQRDAFLAPYGDFEQSISLFNVSLGLSRPASDFGVAAYSTFVFPDDMTQFRDLPTIAARFGGDPAGGMPYYSIADYSRLDAAIRKPDDPYLISICGADRLTRWSDMDEPAERARRAAWTDALIADVDRRFPGFADAVVASEIATSRTMQSFLGTPGGAVYGFRPTPQRLFARPPSPKTTVDGLLLSSAYTVSGGYAGAMQGGLMASREALG